MSENKEPEFYDYFTNHHFNVALAQKYGLIESIILENIIYWTKYNQANNKNLFDGYYWTYNSISAFHELLPYLSEKQIRYALKKLEENEIIKIGNYNKTPYDRTKWYAIMEPSIYTFCQMKEPILQNDNTQNGEPIPLINTDNKPDNKQINSDSNQLDLFPNEQKDKNAKIKEILDHWISCNMIEHSIETLLPKLKKQHREIIKNNEIEKIKQAITNYATVINDQKYWFTYRWSLWDFLIRGLDKFVDEIKPLDNYLKEEFRKKKNKTYENEWQRKHNEIIDNL